MSQKDGVPLFEDRTNGHDRDHDRDRDREKQKHRSTGACVRCRKRHMKCDATGPPCSRCKAAHAVCEYAEAEKKIVVSMKYLRGLHSEIQKLKIENASLRTAKKHSGMPSGRDAKGPQNFSVGSPLEPPSIDDEQMAEQINEGSRVHPLAGAIDEDDDDKSTSTKSEGQGGAGGAAAGAGSGAGSGADATTTTTTTTGSQATAGTATTDDSEVIPPFLDKYGRIIHSRTGDRIYIGSSSMTLFGLEINRLVAAGDESRSPESENAETVLEREGNAYRIMLGKTHTKPGIDVNFTLPSYSYAMLLVDTFISYNDGCFYFFNEGLVKEGLRRVYNDKSGKPFKPDYGTAMSTNPSSPENDSILETIWFCKVLLIFAIGEMYLGTANNLNGYKLNEKHRKKKRKVMNMNDGSQSDQGAEYGGRGGKNGNGKARKSASSESECGGDSSDNKTKTTKLPGSGFFNQASELFAGLFSSGAISNCAREGGVEVLLLYAFYLQVADCTVASYFYFGLALRASLILGLHVDAGRDTLTRYELEHRRRLWWTVYIYERMLASKAGLPLSFTDDDISTELPNDFDMSNPPKDCNNYIFPESEFIRNCVKITQINARILRKLYTRHPSSNILPIVHELVVSLLHWKKELPDYINCDYGMPELQISRLVVNLMTEYLQGINLAVRPLLFHFVMLNLKDNHSGFIDLSRYSSVILTLLNASFQASINTIRSMWALMPDNMVAMFGYMDREYLFTSTVTLILFNSTFGVHEATLEHLDHALTVFTKMRNMGNHPATLRREQILRLLTILDFHGAMRGLIQKHQDHVPVPDSAINSQNDSSGYKFNPVFSKTETPILPMHAPTPPMFKTISNMLPMGSTMPQPALQHLQQQSQTSLRDSLLRQSMGTPPPKPWDYHQGWQDQVPMQSQTREPQPPQQPPQQPPVDVSPAPVKEDDLPGQNPGFSEVQNPVFSPSLLSAIGQIEDVPNLEVMNLTTEDAALWRDITSQAAWLGQEFNQEFDQLANPK